jgi:hypothetical protein
MVARAFHESGFHLGQRESLMPANAGNPAGYFENLDVYRANEAILVQLGGSWFDPPSVARQLLVAEQVTPGIREFLRNLVADGGTAPVALKEPRIGVLLSIWWPVLRDTLHPVLVVRNPEEVAHSLLARDGTPLEHGLAMWELHTTAILKALAGREATVAHHKRMVEEPAQAVALVASATTRLSPALAEEVVADGAVRAVERALYRSHRKVREPGSRLSPSQARLWDLLAGLPSGNARIHVERRLRSPSAAAVSAVKRETSRRRALLNAASGLGAPRI